MTPSIRRWLLSKAQEDLREAEEEQDYCRKDAREMGSRAEENPQTWGEEYERAAKSFKEANAQVTRMREVVADLSSETDEPRIHVLLVGLPLCGFCLSVPAEWPEGHKWVSLTHAGEANCPTCLERMRERGDHDHAR